MTRYSGEATHQDLGTTEDSLAVDFARELLAGLTANKKSIPSRFLYDKRGSELFERITELPEYYPARLETGILRDFAPEFAARACENVAIVELGSGSSKKTKMLLDAFGSKAKMYVAIEISKTALEHALSRIQEQYPQLKTVGICEDFNSEIELPRDVTQHGLIGFFPGTTIGNLERAASIELLRAIRKTLGSDATLVVGIDLVKPPHILIAAYNDSQGVTAEFTRNILLHANHAVGTNFRADTFEHQVIWNPHLQRIETYLLSRRDQTVNVLGQEIHFRVGESVHIENSHKYTIEGFAALVNHAGWKVRSAWTDQQNWFAVFELVEH